jgi:hypothetical protein
MIHARRCSRRSNRPSVAFRELRVKFRTAHGALVLLHGEGFQAGDFADTLSRHPTSDVADRPDIDRATTPLMAINPPVQ